MGINEALDNLYVCATNAKSETLEEGYYEKCYDRVIEELEQKDKEIEYWKEQAEGYSGLAEQIKEDFENRDRWE